MSGGQTGVDQAALRAGLSCGIAIGGWCPPGRICDAGTIPDIFPLIETPSDRSADAPHIPRSERTEWNVRDSDATLILCPAAFAAEDQGTRWTSDCASHYGKPVLTCDPSDLRHVHRAQEWISNFGVETLNIAGPSEATCPGIGASAEAFVLDLLAKRRSQRACVP
jgi:hypothetical protein